MMSESSRHPLDSVSSAKSEDLEVNEELKCRYRKLMIKAKEKAQQGEIKRAIELCQDAYSIHASEKLLKRIDKLEEFLKEYGEEEAEDPTDEMVTLDNGFAIYKDLYNRLYPYQREGIVWMYRLFKTKKGGILGDDMGLGKTIQVIAFLSGLIDSEKMQSCMIVMPVSLILNWEKEFDIWAPGIKVRQFHGTSKKERELSLEKVQRRGGVLLTTYGMIVSNFDQLSMYNNRIFKWDYVILDEGHKIKNPTKTTKAINAIPARNRLVLTGTPLQNNLKELWSLFDFVHHGSLLGTVKTFNMEYGNPITRAREKDASIAEKRLGTDMAESLRKLINPYFLRRTKDEVLKSPSKQSMLKKLTHKNDFIIWLFMADAQLQIYKDFLGLDRIKEILMATRSPLAELTVLKKICDHPRLLSNRSCSQLGLYGEENGSDDDDDDDKNRDAVRVDNIPDDVLIQESGKMVILLALLEHLRQNGNRTLIFSHSRRMLNIIQKILQNRNFKIMRLDGTIRLTAERQHLINTFQSDPSYQVFLLTTQVGGVGLTLTAADRVIIFDPSWNPATDAQAVDRVYRIGQSKSVVVYRLITCGTIEEKIYRKQVFKDSITRQTTGATKNPFRYFTNQELRELFTLDNPRHSSTQVQLEQMHSHERNSYTELDEHIAFLYSLELFGISDHDLLFSKTAIPADAHEEAQVETDYIQARIKKAQEVITLESQISEIKNSQMTEESMAADIASVPRILIGEKREDGAVTRTISNPGYTCNPVYPIGVKPTPIIDIATPNVLNNSMTDLTLNDKESLSFEERTNIPHNDKTRVEMIDLDEIEDDEIISGHIQSFSSPTKETINKKPKLSIHKPFTISESDKYRDLVNEKENIGDVNNKPIMTSLFENFISKKDSTPKSLNNVSNNFLNVANNSTNRKSINNITPTVDLYSSVIDDDNSDEDLSLMETNEQASDVYNSGDLFVMESPVENIENRSNYKMQISDSPLNRETDNRVIQISDSEDDMISVQELSIQTSLPEDDISTDELYLSLKQSPKAVNHRKSLETIASTSNYNSMFKELKRKEKSQKIYDSDDSDSQLPDVRHFVNTTQKSLQNNSTLLINSQNAIKKNSSKIIESDEDSDSQLPDVQYNVKEPDMDDSPICKTKAKKHRLVIESSDDEDQATPKSAQKIQKKRRSTAFIHPLHKSLILSESNTATDPDDWERDPVVPGENDDDDDYSNDAHFQSASEGNDELNVLAVEQECFLDESDENFDALNTSVENYLSPERCQRYKSLLLEGRQAYKSGNLLLAMQHVLNALDIYDAEPDVQKMALVIREKMRIQTS